MLSGLLILTVPGTGFEPARPFEHHHLKVACLPISTPGQLFQIFQEFLSNSWFQVLLFFPCLNSRLESFGINKYKWFVSFCTSVFSVIMFFESSFNITRHANVDIISYLTSYGINDEHRLYLKVAVYQSCLPAGRFNTRAWGCKCKWKMESEK